MSSYKPRSNLGSFFGSSNPDEFFSVRYASPEFNCWDGLGFRAFLPPRRPLCPTVSNRK